MISKSNRERLLASTILVGATALTLMGAGSAMAQGTDTKTGNSRVITTQENGQSTPSSRVQTDAAGLVAPGDNGTQVGEVVVTGSRIARRDFVADSPIVTVNPKAIENTGDITLERVFTQLPQVQLATGSQINNGGNGQVNISLRGIGTTRTLVLVDGRRAQPSNASGVIDLNTIPSALIESIETITGGASSAYGSDAVAGVVNFKLKHNFQGLTIDTLYNVTEHGDGQEQGVQVTAGGNFADDKGNAVLSFAYSNRDAVFYGQRPDITISDYQSFGLVDPRIFAVGGFSSTIPQGSAVAVANLMVNAAGTNVTGANSFTQAAVNTVFAKYGVAPGSIAVNAGTTFGFNSDGTLFFKGLNYKGPTSIDFSTIPTTGPTGVNGVAANGAGAYNTGALNYVLTPQTRYNVYGSAEYAITPHAKAYGQFMFTQNTANTVLAPTPASGSPATALGAASTASTGFLVPVTNPYIPADLRTILASRPNPNAPFLFAKRISDFGARNAQLQYTVYQILTGIRGDIPDPGNHDLTYDVYGTYGKTTTDSIQTGNLNRTLFRQYLESPTGSLSGCTGYNPFGSNGLSSQCRAFFSPTTKNYEEFTERVVEGTVQGRAITLAYGDHIGGEIRFATGADYRQDKYNFVPDGIAASFDTSGTVGSNTNPYNNAVTIAGFNASQPLAGTIDVYEAYTEGLIPLVKDLPFAKRIDLSVGARFSDYNFSSAGRESQIQATTYKADVQWKVLDWLLVRGGYARAIRAPNVGDLFTPLQQNFAAIGTPSANGLGQGDPCDINGAYRRGNGVNAAAVSALCLAQGVPAGTLATFQQTNSQAPSTSGGNPNLREERANTYTGGFVISPKFSMPLFSRVSLSVDYYNISIQGAIGAIGLGTSLAKCFNSDGSNPTYTNSNQFCQNIVRDTGSGQISNGFANAQNTGGLKTSGIDFQADWQFGLSSLPYVGISDKWGQLGFNFIVTWLNDLNVRDTPTDNYRQLRDSESNPAWKALLGVNYSVGPIDLGVTERYVGEGRDGSCTLSSAVCTAHGVDPVFYTNLTARWKINDVLELRGGVDNVTAQDPRFFSSGSSSQALSDGTVYDFLGRRYYVGLKARF